VTRREGVSRRGFFHGAAVVAGSSSVISTTQPHHLFAGPRPLPLKIGLTSYSMRKQTLDQVIDFCKEAEIRYLNLKTVHLPISATPEQIQAGRAKVEAAGITITGGGVVEMRDDEDEVRRAFEYARIARLPLLIGGLTTSAVDLVEGMVKEYGIPVAIHNNGPEDHHFQTPYDALAVLRRRDRRMGVCLDVGHAVRAGADPVRCVADLGDRLFDVHIKDLKDKTDKGSQVAIGLGVIDIAGLMKALNRRHFQGHIAVEYEMHPDNPGASIRESLAYVRGVAAALCS
jgi:sugar phosphate isomerase/epimerase